MLVIDACTEGEEKLYRMNEDGSVSKEDFHTWEEELPNYHLDVPLPAQKRPPGQQGCTRGPEQKGNEKHDAPDAPCGTSGGLCRQAVKAVEGTAGQPGGDVPPGEGDSGEGDCLGKAAVGDRREQVGGKRVRREQVTNRDRAVPALVLIRHVQPTGMIQKKQTKMTDFTKKHFK